MTLGDYISRENKKGIKAEKQRSRQDEDHAQASVIQAWGTLRVGTGTLQVTVPTRKDCLRGPVRHPGVGAFYEGDCSSRANYLRIQGGKGCCFLG